ncbi:hypothetical protein IVB05_21700 [Bradyrhizobium sp. 170]|nr:hypothetical protein IVB05_21700 [Bradyrhizobium sp. 170]
MTPIVWRIRHITVHPHRKRSATIRSVICAGMPNELTTSSAAPVSDWLRMRQAIVRPLNSILPDFKPCHPNSVPLVMLSQFERMFSPPADKALLGYSNQMRFPHFLHSNMRKAVPVSESMINLTRASLPSQRRQVSSDWSLTVAILLARNRSMTPTPIN